MYLVFCDNDGYWLVPVRQNGWYERSPFIGRVNHLRKITDLGEVDLGMFANFVALNCG